MKILKSALLILAACLLVCCQKNFSTTNDNDLNRLGLNGSVAHIVTRTADGSERIEYYFDTCGMTTMQSYYLNDTLLWLTTYTDTLRMQIDREGDTIWAVEVLKDEQGTIETEVSHSQIGEVITYYSYNDQGLPTMQTDIIEDGLLSATQYEYDDSGLLIKEVHVDAEGQISEVFVYTYQNDKLISIEQYNGDDTLAEQQVFAYDRAGNQTEEYHINRFGETTYSCLSTYNNGLLTTRQCSGEYIYNTIYTYAYENGVLKSEHIAESDNIDGTEQIVLLTKRECDSQGNWVSEYLYESQFDTDSLVLIETRYREINYY